MIIAKQSTRWFDDFRWRVVCTAFTGGLPGVLDADWREAARVTCGSLLPGLLMLRLAVAGFSTGPRQAGVAVMRKKKLKRWAQPALCRWFLRARLDWCSY